MAMSVNCIRPIDEAIRPLLAQPYEVDSTRSDCSALGLLARISSLCNSASSLLQYPVFIIKLLTTNNRGIRHSALDCICAARDVRATSCQLDDSASDTSNCETACSCHASSTPAMKKY